ncbi:hypothetical protein C0992_003016 [Termitomyces sp. T32_za158]|nr:hypothetical protein C0992_003016 [Termitomyces sp. T32_za158]
MERIKEKDTGDTELTGICMEVVKLFANSLELFISATALSDSLDPMSLPIAFSVGSASSGQSVRDVIASYDEENDIYPGEGDAEVNNAEPDRNHGNWDQSGLEVEANDLECASSSLQPINTSLASELLTPVRMRYARETTPLLRKALSFSASSHPRRLASPNVVDNAVPETHATVDFLQPPSSFPRRLSAGSSKSARYDYGGQSTFGQTLFNSTAILLGIGMLSEPLAFAYSGWVTGTILIIGYGFVSCYTAKILAHIILSDHRLRSYADIGRKAFGQSSMPLISLLFCLELFSVSIILVTLYADSLHTLIPRYSTTTYKLWGLLLLVPTIFLPLSLLSYTSILGILSSILIIFVVLTDGFCKSEAPGSIWRPAETNFGVHNPRNLGLAFGLFMAGFSGHAVIPSLARDMKDPSQFDRMINWAFFVATMLYALIGYAGYLMFGNNVSEEISIDLMRTSGYNPILNTFALWMLVLSPLSKFALTTQPLNATIEILLGIDVPLLTPEDMATKSNGLTTAPQGSHVVLKRFFAVTQRVMMTVLSVTISILVPDFGAMMALLGSFAAFALCIIGPLSAKIALTGRCSMKDGILLAVGVIMAIWGMVATAYAAT